MPEHWKKQGGSGEGVVFYGEVAVEVEAEGFADEIFGDRPIGEVLAARDAAAVDVLALLRQADQSVEPGS